MGHGLIIISSCAKKDSRAKLTIAFARTTHNVRL